MSRMRWKVMKAFGLPPTSPLIKNMNDYQWSYCFLNLAKDIEEETSRLELDHIRCSPPYKHPERDVGIS